VQRERKKMIVSEVGIKNIKEKEKYKERKKFALD